MDARAVSEFRVLYPRKDDAGNTSLVPEKPYTCYASTAYCDPFTTVNGVVYRRFVSGPSGQQPGLGELRPPVSREDYGPILPPLCVGYMHASGPGQVKLLLSKVRQLYDKNTVFWAFAGQYNNSTLYSTGDGPKVLAGNISNHSGPYDGVLLGRS
ncbi:hypothetical protein FISHEDRAFT_58646 [Fistulina hepatica ATCC 64428]|uniref:Uncharacterized protein n=1 Tax=Fistulina hepatica ATCC 64428 TaxID=1128425 RepID=A0A0D7AG87_9AGAR|nr:hypothetical protein FISHEDRAFT_58646 [Fistulina hepatica ATCC 64428]